MASWLKAAEDLFEVVDKRAKLVVGENPDEQPNSRLPVSNGQGTQPRRSRPKRKSEKQASSNEKPPKIEIGNDKASLDASVSDLDADKNKAESVTEKHPSGPSSSSGEVINKETSVADGSTSGASLYRTISIDEMKHETNHAEETETVNNVEVAASNSNVEPSSDSISVGHRGTPSADNNDHDVVHNDQPADSSENIKLGDSGSPKTVPEASQSLSAQAPNETDTKYMEGALSVKPDPGEKKNPEKKTVTSAMKVQEQLDEAQGLLKSAISTGQTKEARLAKVCAGLSSRLQEYKSENAQLEELLVAERELSRSYEARLKQLQKELSESKNEVNRAESNMLEALAAKNAEIEALVNSMDSVKKQAALTEGNLASLQANMESIMRNRELTETRMMQAMREELAAAERRAEEERTAHSATKMAAMEREVELEHRAIDASTALARTQRIADERTAKAAELEQKVALLEAECSSLNQELQDMEARARRGQKKSPEEANQLIQIQAWQEEVERARQSQREAESKLSSQEAEMQKMRVEMAAMKRDAEHYSRQEHMELEKRYRELTDLLYYKQTQLETMASEKAAAEFHLEKEMKRLQEAQLEAERNRASRRASSSYWEEDTDIKALEPLPLHNRHMAGASIQLQRAAKLLDFGAVRATRFLWRYPTARVLLLFYLVFVHLFLMYLLHRLQEQADTFTSREVAASMGLANQTLP